MVKTPNEHLRALLAMHPRLTACAADLTRAFEALRDCFRAGGKLLLCGNGGSCADCDHIVGELMKGFLLKRKVLNSQSLGPEGALLQGALPAISLAGQSALSTAIANDTGAEMVFAQQVYGLGRAGDALLALSTSGNAGNVLRALRVARAMGLTAIGLTGDDGGAMRAYCDICVRVPAKETYLIQELHLPLYHALCAMLEAEFFVIQ